MITCKLIGSFTICSLLFVAHAFASSESHGGDSVICLYDVSTPWLDRGISTDTAFFFRDYFDAAFGAEVKELQYNSLYHRTPSRGEDDSRQDYLEIATQIIEKIKGIDPQRYERYIGHIKSFHDEAYIGNLIMPEIEHDQTPLIITNDFSKHGSLHQFHSCRIEQAAYQLPDPESIVDEHRYYVRSLIWNNLDEVNRATLILHEVIYREAIEWGHTKAKYTEKFVRTLLEKDYPYGADEHAAFMESLGFGGTLSP